MRVAASRNAGVPTGYRMGGGSGGCSVHSIKACAFTKALMADEWWQEVEGIQSIVGTLGQGIMKSRAELSGLTLGIEAL